MGQSASSCYGCMTAIVRKPTVGVLAEHVHGPVTFDGFLNLAPVDINI
jgi:hypothetical protein